MKKIITISTGHDCTFSNSAAEEKKYTEKELNEKVDKCQSKNRNKKNRLLKLRKNS